MQDFWQSVVDDLVFQHCDGEGLKGILERWLHDPSFGYHGDVELGFDLEWTRHGFELVPWNELNKRRLEFVYREGELNVFDEDWEPSLVRQMIGQDRMRAIEVMLREVQLCGTKV